MKTITLLALTLAGSMACASAVSAKSNPLLAAPQNLVCANDESNVGADWDLVDGASKYSVEYTAGYDTDGDGCVDTTQDFDYGTTEATISTPLTDFDYSVCADPPDCTTSTTYTAMQVQLRVKGLNPPKGGPRGSGGTQNNPFSAVCSAYDVTTCTQ